MVRVELNLLNIFALKTKTNTLIYEGKTVGDIITQFINEYKDKLDDSLLDKSKKKLNPQMIVLLNGKNVSNSKGYKTKLKEGDKLYLSFPISGG
ncbi:MAG: MoaD/ThiS family protein [Promethearchaeota archaeon]